MKNTRTASLDDDVLALATSRYDFKGKCELIYDSYLVFLYTLCTTWCLYKLLSSWISKCNPPISSKGGKV